MSVDKHSDILDYVDSEAFRKLLRDEVLEYEYVNGRKIISPTYALKMEAVDPQSVMSLMNNTANTNDLKTHLININVKRAILEEIALVNGDVTSNSLHYFNIVESFGFTPILNNNKNQESSKIYHNLLNGLLLVIDGSNNDSIFKATLYGQGKVTDPEIFKNLKCHTSILEDKETQQIRIDVKSLFSSKMECLLKSVKLNKCWNKTESLDNTDLFLIGIKKSLNLLEEKPINSEPSELHKELVKKITHRMKKTLQ
jgi:hypothetical protein